jgi:hypothetical protein
LRGSLIRSLTHYWRANLAVVLCCAVAAAVLSGALVVGDSVRGSLRDLTLERLGAIDHAVRSPAFFTAELASRVASELGGASSVVPIVLLSGSARQPESGALASGVGVQGVDRRFFALFPGGAAVNGVAAAPATAPGSARGGVLVNQALADELDVAPGDTILLAVERRGDAPRETLYGSGETSDVVRELRLTVTQVLPDRGLGRFSLEPDQTLPLLAFVDLASLQEALEEEGRANTLVVDLGTEEPAGEDARAGAPSRDAEANASIGAVHRALTTEDLGLEIERGEGFVALESRDLVLSPALETMVERYATTAGAPLLRVSTYLANQLAAGERSVPYSAIAALDPVAAQAFGGLPLVDGGIAGPLDEDEVLIDEWVAEDLGIAAADDILSEQIVMSYFEVGPGEELVTRERAFTVRGIVALRGLGADPDLTPDFPGISTADDMAAWDPPFPIDLDRIRPRDEAYWDRYRATPKAFFAPQAAALWSTRFGGTTLIRLAATAGASVESLLTDLRSELPRLADPGALGFRFDAVRERGLAASAGGWRSLWPASPWAPRAPSSTPV